ncbi:MAG: hypothetical protein ACL93V_02340 [Candidatus Electrothrix sp. YB6]
MKKILAAFAGNTVFANIVLPQFSVDKISVSVAYPGADPEEEE